MKRKLPPTSQRYCAFCKAETTFRYNRNIGHSCCVECSWHYIPTLDPKGIYAAEVESFLRAKEERKLTPEYQERKKQHIQIKEKERTMQLLAYSKETLRYRQIHGN
jgi:hypothetical protein